MLFSASLAIRLKRRAITVFLIVFAMITMGGPLAHACIGESFSSFSKDQLSSHGPGPHDDGHGHNHEDDWPAEASEQHSHDHNPGDHSHEVPAVTACQAGELNGVSNGRYMSFWAQCYARALFDIDRPPRI